MFTAILASLRIIWIYFTSDGKKWWKITIYVKVYRSDVFRFCMCSFSWNKIEKDIYDSPTIFHLYASAGLEYSLFAEYI